MSAAVSRGLPPVGREIVARANGGTEQVEPGLCRFTYQTPLLNSTAVRAGPVALAQ